MPPYADCNDAKDKTLIEPISDFVPIVLSSETYVRYVETLLATIDGWCKRQGLTVESGFKTIKEGGKAEYEAPSRDLSTDGRPLAKLVPIGTHLIGVQGRVDLVGRVTKHSFVLCVGTDPLLSTRDVVGGKIPRSSSFLRRSRTSGDGWYWIESVVLRAKRIDEDLFLDLLTDVSDYEF